MLNPTDGHIIAGVVLDGHRFSGKMRGAQLLQLAVDPRKTEDLEQVSASTDLESLRKMRTEVQRLFEGAKAKNVEPYANYIVAVNAGQDGMTPPIILFTESELPIYEKEDGTAFLQIPYGAQVVAIDGETQLAARFQAGKINSSTKTEFVPVLVCHGRNIAWARQVFHDLNLLGVRPNAAVGISMDARDPLTYVARQVEQRLAFFSGRVNTVRRQLKKSDLHVVTITGLRGGCVTLAEGIGGVKYGARPVILAQAEVPRIIDVATEWFGAVVDAIGPAIEDRARTVAGSPPVLAAIGAVGHELVKIEDPLVRAARRRELLDKLLSVRWDKSKAWEGIAGKFSAKGKFSIGGSKETAYAVYGALTDSTTEGFAKIRISAAAA
jgi:hypothetical protein